MNRSDSQLIKEAAQWLVELDNSSASAAMLSEIDQWCLRSPQHRRAWALALELSQGLSALPQLPSASAESLSAVRHRRGRRAVLRALMVAGVAVPTAAVVGELTPWRSWTAAYQTAYGELRQLQLADGVAVAINTASALDIDSDRRQLWLRSGEILVSQRSVGVDDRLIVHTRDGAVDLRNARASIRVQASATRVASLMGESLLQRAGAVPQRVPQGRAGVFGAAADLRLVPSTLNDEVWTQGLVHADETPLPEFIALLSRYHRGVIRCEQRLADLRISGLYHHADLDGILRLIAKSYPVRLRFVTPLWVSLEQA